MKAAGKNIVVTAPSVGPSQTPSGLYIAPSADQAQVISGVVESIGPAVAEGIVVVGERVHFNKFNATKVTVDGRDYMALPIEQVLVIE